MKEPWLEMITGKQRKTLNAACGDLSAQIVWHGIRMSKDSWRHFLSGLVLGQVMVPSYDDGNGQTGFIFLGRSSGELSRENCIKAITIAFHIGDDPESQGLKAEPVKWCDAVMFARGFNPKDLAA